MKFLIFIFQLIIFILITITIIKNSIIVSFEINDFIYSISSSYLFIGLFIFLSLTYFFLNFYFKTKFKLSKFKIDKVLNKKEMGYSSFVNGMIALANKDYKKAHIENKKVSNFLKDNTDLSLLLKSEIFKFEKNMMNWAMYMKKCLKKKAQKI